MPAADNPLKLGQQVNSNGLLGPNLNSKSSKNLSHVPCKFFRQGACQAGNLCPFSHSMESMSRSSPCKYFQKGNCKFGLKCALAHVLPDGRKVNTKAIANNNVHQNNHNLEGSYNNSYSAATSPINASSNQNSKLNYTQTSPAVSPQVAFHSSSIPYKLTSFWNDQTADSSFSTVMNSVNSTEGNFTSSVISNGTSSLDGSYGAITVAGLKEVSNHITSEYEEDIHDLEQVEEEELKFEEDYVPSSLMDLLSSQELKRKIAKNSPQEPSSEKITFSGSFKTLPPKTPAYSSSASLSFYPSTDWTYDSRGGSQSNGWMVNSNGTGNQFGNSAATFACSKNLTSSSSSSLSSVSQNQQFFNRNKFNGIKETRGNFMNFPQEIVEDQYLINGINELGFR